LNGKGERKSIGKKASLGLAATEVARIQAAVADGVLRAEPCEETLETKSVTAVGGGTVPEGNLETV
jgi:hypothetical protein